MALANAMQGGRRPSQQITWTREDGTAEDLTGASLTGRIRNQSDGSARAITGSLVIVTAAAGIFRWDYSVADVAAAGEFVVQFSAAFGTAPTPALTISEQWSVREAI